MNEASAIAKAVKTRTASSLTPSSKINGDLAPNARCILIIGMHRSGTSALTGLFKVLGIPVPGELLPPAPDNPKGFFENKAIVELHDSLLDQLKSSWTDPLPFHPDWMASYAGQEACRRLSKTISREVGDAAIYAFKDPRICRLVPLWRAAVEGIASLGCIHMLRHPSEVSASLAHRDNLEREQSLALWLRYVLDAERETRGLQRCFITYDGLLHDWQLEVEKIGSALGLIWPFNLSRAENEAGDFLSGNLKHQDAAVLERAADDGLQPICDRVWKIFRSLQIDSEDPSAKSDLDAVDKMLNSASSLFGPLLLSERRLVLDAQAEKVSDENRFKNLETLHADVKAKAVAEIETLRAESEKLLTSLQEANERQERLLSDLAKSEVNHAEVNRNAVSLRSIIDDLERQNTVLIECAERAESEKFREFRYAEAKISKIEAAASEDAFAYQAKIAALEVERAGLIDRAESMKSQLSLAARQAEIESRARFHAESRLHLIHLSRAWRFARILQKVSGRFPFIRRTAKLLWWMATMQLPGQLRRRRDHANLVTTIRNTGLFDEEYYRRHNPDLALSNMDLALQYALHGWRERRNPSDEFDTGFYLDQNPDVVTSGLNPLLHFTEWGRQEGRKPKAHKPDTHVFYDSKQVTPHIGNGAAAIPSARSLIRSFDGSWLPLPVFSDRGAKATLTIITDGIDANRLFGGVATAIVVGATIAQRMEARLRLVTRHDAPDPAVLGHVLNAHKVSWNGETDFVHMPLHENKPLPIGAQDLVLTTSWWTTRAVLGSIEAEKVLYLLQEDERMFYPYGDVRLRCSETLSEPKLRMLVNTHLLFGQLADGADELRGLRERAYWFDPAFPAIPKPKTLSPRGKKQNFFFYARPNNDRNLYWRGLEVIDTVMREGLLASEEWNIHFVGSDLPNMELPGGNRPIVSFKMPWAEYCHLVGEMDLGLCLMDTPHPSYPPLDLAAAGAVVVTNTHGPKTSLDRWSRNIIATSPNVKALSKAIRDALPLSRDLDWRLANCAADNIPRNWDEQLRPAMEWLNA